MGMLTWFFVALVAGLSSSGHLRGCYFTNWAQFRDSFPHFPEDIDVNLCTHLFFAFAKLSDNQLKPLHWSDETFPCHEGMYKRLNDLKEKKPELKTLLAVGGANAGTAEMTRMLSTQENRTQFIKTSIEYLRGRNFDGLDLVFEFPGNKESPPEDKQRFTLLVKELREAFENEEAPETEKKLILTATVSGVKEVIDAAYEVDKLNGLFDLINLMTYDFHGAWESVTGHNAPLYSKDYDLNLDWSAKYWVSKGFNPAKVLIGMPGYGRCFTLKNPEENGIGAPVTGPCEAGEFTKEPGFLSYYEICKLVQDPSSKVQWSEEQLVPFLSNGKLWVGYDDAKSLKLKVEYLKKSGFAGWFFWDTSLDDFNGTVCGSGRYPLLTALKEALGEEESEISTKDSESETSGHDHSVHDHSDHSTSPLDYICHGKPDGDYKNPADCHSFVTCTSEVASVTKCPSNLYFDDEEKTCAKEYDLPEKRRKECREGPQTNNDGKHRHPTDCRSFVICSSGVASVDECPSELFFDDVSKSCAVESGLPIDRKKECGLEPSTPEFDCHDKPDDDYKHPTDCHSFVTCSSGVATVRECPSKLYFDEVTKSCTYGSSLPVERQKECGLEPPSPSYDCYRKPDGDYKHPTDCHSFVTCSDGAAFFKECPSKLYFDDVTKSCTEGYKLPEERQKECGLDIPTTSAPEFDCYRKPDGDYKHPTDCHSFVTCSDGAAFFKECPSKLYFDDVTKSCTEGYKLPEERQKECGLDIPTTSAPEFDCYRKPDGDYKHPTDCHSFVTCSDGAAFFKECPSKLYFDDVTKSCTEGYKLPEERQKECGLDIPTTSAPEFDCYRKPDGDYKHPTDCHSFVTCSDGAAFFKECPSKLYFDDVSKSCTEGYKLPEERQKECGLDIPTTSAPEFDCYRKPDGDYEHPTDCHSFVTCSNGIASVTECPSNLYFDKVTKSCTYGSSLPEERQKECEIESPSSEFDCHKKPDGDYKHPTDCHSFVTCSNGIASVTECPSNLYFDEVTKSCTYGSSLPEERQKECGLDRSTTAHPKFDCYRKPDGDYKHPTDCHSFVTCSDGITYFKECPSKLYFDDETKSCTEGYKLPEERQKECGLEIPTTSAPKFDCYRKPDGDYKHPSDCHSFVTCSHGVASVNECPLKLFFDDVTKSCTFAYRLPVDRKKECGLEKPTTSTPEKLDCYEMPDGRYEHPRDCHSYVVCDAGIASVEECPSDLYFDTVAKSCIIAHSLPEERVEKCKSL